MATGTSLIGTAVNRVEGRAKITGAAQYAAEAQLANLAYAVMVGSTAASAATVPGGFERAGTSPDECLYADGHITLLSDPSKSLGYAESLALSGRDSLEAEAKTKPNSLYNDRCSLSKCVFLQTLAASALPAW